MPSFDSTRGVRKLVNRMLDERERLVVTYTPEGPHYSLARSGRTVRQDVAERAIEGLHLLPQSDGLFGFETPQTYEVASI